jgi:hypothetical protein
VSRKNSDFLFFSVVLLMAVFAAPAIAGPCLTLGECPAPVVADCHDEEGEAAESCCCEARAVPDATRENLKQKDSVWLVASPQALGAAGNGGAALHAKFMPPAPPIRGEPLFVFNGSFLI